MSLTIRPVDPWNEAETSSRTCTSRPSGEFQEHVA